MLPMTRMSMRSRPAPALTAVTAGLSTAACVMALLWPVGDALAAQPPVGLGTADSFAVLAGSTVTNTGPSTINGNLGVAPGAAVTGLPPGTVNGTIHAANAVAGQAQSDLTIAYDDAAARTPPVAVPADLGGLTLTGGVYKAASSLGLTGALTLDAQGNPNSVFVFQAASTLTTASGSHVNLINGAQPCNVFWQVGSSATLGTASVFTGNILALTSISVNNGVTVAGRTLARNGAVTLINDTITAPRCAPGTTGGDGGGTRPGSTTGGSTTGGGTGNQNGTALFTTLPSSVANTVAQFGTSHPVHGNFQAVVTGLLIKRVVFTLDGRVIATRGRSPFKALVRPARGIHTLIARVTFTDGTPPATFRLRFRATGAARRHGASSHSPSRRPRTPSGFTG